MSLRTDKSAPHGAYILSMTKQVVVGLLPVVLLFVALTAPARAGEPAASGVWTVNAGGFSPGELVFIIMGAPDGRICVASDPVTGDTHYYADGAGDVRAAIVPGGCDPTPGCWSMTVASVSGREVRGSFDTGLDTSSDIKTGSNGPSCTDKMGGGGAWLDSEQTPPHPYGR